MGRGRTGPAALWMPSLMTYSRYLHKTIFVPLLTIILSVAGTQVQAQQPQAAGGAPGFNGGPPNFEEMRKEMRARTREALKATDEEWSVIDPLLEKVEAKQRQLMAGRFGGFGPRPGGPPPLPSGNAQQNGGSASRGNNAGNRGGDPSFGSPETDALRAALADEKTSADEINAKLNAVREQRKQAAAELAAARSELSAVLTVRQEAVLVSMGVLE